ncbi:hypothetical protein SKAU_G00167930 [Synaphobranchus kaupii]|uniref:TOG domain-containing protein n=1 Tax=Synaphobranchus kaupii TaxID=118154 RepID=A0A9Q1FK26_SYNKA|nr:hypothetical protein SKAU_G00167930 [Synaphobranchus kaupii]
MGQACPKKLRVHLSDDNRNRQNNVRHPSDDAALLFLVASEQPGPSALRLTQTGATSEPLGPSAQRLTKKQLTTKGHVKKYSDVHAGNAQAESTNQLIWMSSVPPRDSMPAGSRVYVVRRMKLPDDRVQTVIDEVPEPKRAQMKKPKKLEEVTDFGQTEPLIESSDSPVQDMCKKAVSIQSTVLGQSESQALKSTLPSQSESRALSQAQVAKTTRRNAYIKQLMARMGSKEIEERIRAIGQLVDDCTLKPSMVVSCIFPVFDSIRARLVESNRMVNLHMLKALGTIIPQMKESLSKVVYMLIPAIINNHINSKTYAIYIAALAAIRSIVHNLDNSFLLEIFVTKTQLLSGHAKTDLTDIVADMAMELYPRRPKMVEQEVLPLLWHLLVVCSRSAATVTLFRALYFHMGPRLWASAACQPLSIRRGLHQLLSSAHGYKKKHTSEHL